MASNTTDNKKEGIFGGLYVDKHVEYVKSLDKRHDEIEYWMTEHLRISGIYWGLVALHLLGREDSLDRDQIIAYVKKCQNADGGFGGHIAHDSHLLYTMSAVQILVMYDALDQIDGSEVVSFVCSLQDDKGEVSGDQWGEKDTRFAFISVAILSFFNATHRINVDGIVDYVCRSMNYDGAFGSQPGGESHSAQVYTCLAALAIVGKLEVVDRERLSSWLAERQVKCGGLNGRPQKLEDVCYSWWVLSSMQILRRVHWIDRMRLCEFILSAQDTDAGGIADRPGDIADVYHTCFGLCGLSLAGFDKYPLEAIDPVYCMPVKIVERAGLHSWTKNIPQSWNEQ
ncbi:Rab geranylgeranyltransferase [Coemansia sp. RSA 1813]|nr:Rab geranylgeranyltransferase [Coemansia sp. RSA 1646]KAJ1770338.1 Rab geranylgeranyltransferase [Coemansia sp. RSA 1843]KAJ2091646.1 Rab geranylgeranyltransferase [Coemansia sp. RSA 986]KAJ2216951.1 Rab geranylgeranyltransferase [Coemansia sp. RSA 487]KAJ2571956.1 Rab geranylgeranyltransferase [Coemansia sp. RSA 1813]